MYKLVPKESAFEMPALVNTAPVFESRGGSFVAAGATVTPYMQSLYAACRQYSSYAAPVGTYGGNLYDPDGLFYNFRPELVGGGLTDWYTGTDTLGLVGGIGAFNGALPAFTVDIAEMNFDLDTMAAAVNAVIHSVDIGQPAPAEAEFNYDYSGCLQPFTESPEPPGYNGTCPLDKTIAGSVSIPYTFTATWARNAPDVFQGTFSLTLAKLDGKGGYTAIMYSLSDESISQQDGEFGSDAVLLDALAAYYGGPLPENCTGVADFTAFNTVTFDLTPTGTIEGPFGWTMPGALFQSQQKEFSSQAKGMYAIFAGTPPEPPIPPRRTVSFTFPIPGEYSGFFNWSLPVWKERIPFQNYSFSVANTVLIRGK